jgi:siroheme synthase-like protein
VKTYPVFLVGLAETRCVVVGGGKVAARKVAALHEAGAQVLIISPRLCAPLEELVAKGGVEVLARDYRHGDLEGAFLAVAATDDSSVNEAVWEEAKAHGLLVNVVDDPEHCNFVAPSVVRRGPLTLAISTSGHCPALSGHIREQLEQEFGPAYADFVQLLGDLRATALDQLSLARRRDFWQEVFASDVLTLLATGNQEKALARALSILEQSVSGGD